MKLKFTQVVGLNTDQVAAQVLAENLSEENVFLVVVKLTCDDAFTKGREVLVNLADFYSSLDSSPAQNLAASFEEAQKGLADTENPQVLLASLSGKVLYLISQGQIKAYIKRFDQVLPILTAETISGQLISGYLQEGDRLFLGTDSLTSFLGNLDQAFDGSLEEWKEEFNSKIAAASLENGALAGILLDVQSEEELVIPKPVIEQETQLQTGSNLLQIFKRVNLGKLMPRSGRGRLILALVLILALGMGVGYQYKLNKDKEKQTNFQKYFQQAKNDWTLAKQFKSLNPTDVQIKVDSAKSNLDKALSIDSSNKDALALKKEIADNSSSVLQKFQSVNTPLFLDLSLIKPGFSPKSLNLSSGKILVLDTSSKSLVTIDVDKKSNQVLAGKDQLGDGQLASLNGSSAFVYSADKGIVKIDSSSKKDTLVSKSDKEWGEIVDLAGFGGNVYLLDSKNNQIYKYIATSSGYSDKRNYLNEGVKADFANSLRMQIESSVYILKQGGEIIRYTRGAPDFFSLGGLDKGIKDPKSFFTSSDTDNLYILDSGNSRVVVVDKKGSYLAQYQSDKFTTASDLVVDEKGKKVYFLDSDKIYSMDLK